MALSGDKQNQTDSKRIGRSRIGHFYFLFCDMSLRGGGGGGGGVSATVTIKTRKENWSLGRLVRGVRGADP